LKEAVAENPMFYTKLYGSEADTVARVGNRFAKMPSEKTILKILMKNRKAYINEGPDAFRNAVRVAQDGTVKFMDEIADLRKAETYELNEEWWILNKLNKLGSPGQLKSVAEAELRKGALLDIRNIRAIIFEDAEDAHRGINTYLKNVTGHDLEEYIEVIEKYARAYTGKFDDILEEFKGFRNAVEYKKRVVKLAMEAELQKALLAKTKEAEDVTRTNTQGAPRKGNAGDRKGSRELYDSGAPEKAPRFFTKGRRKAERLHRGPLAKGTLETDRPIPKNIGDEFNKVYKDEPLDFDVVNKNKYSPALDGGAFKYGIEKYGTPALPYRSVSA
jgi:hypothetical protein